MELNFETKILEIRAVMKSWQYRFISPLGRACIAKTLLLSKLCHLAFVIPSLSKKHLKLLENEIYNFIWQSREKVTRADAKQPEKMGGLSFPDILSSWSAYKFSWFRRMAISKSIWKDIFVQTLSINIGIDLDTFFTKIGSAEYSNIAK